MEAFSESELPGIRLIARNLDLDPERTGEGTFRD
jgi:hypothetical protein